MSQKFNFFLHSQPVGLGLIVELLAIRAGHAADVLADARDFASDSFEFCRCFVEQTSSLVFPVRRLRHCSSHSTT